MVGPAGRRPHHTDELPGGDKRDRDAPGFGAAERRRACSPGWNPIAFGPGFAPWRVPVILVVVGGRTDSDLQRFRVVRVIEQSPDFLRYLTETGLRLEAQGQVVANRDESGTITVEVAGRQTTLAHTIADRLLVT